MVVFSLGRRHYDITEVVSKFFLQEVSQELQLLRVTRIKSLTRVTVHMTPLWVRGQEESTLICRTLNRNLVTYLTRRSPKRINAGNFFAQL